MAVLRATVGRQAPRDLPSSRTSPRPMPDAPDHYKVLQVDSEAEDEVIQAAYRRLARKYHPDMAGGDEAAARMGAVEAVAPPPQLKTRVLAAADRTPQKPPRLGSSGTTPGPRRWARRSCGARTSTSCWPAARSTRPTMW